MFFKIILHCLKLVTHRKQLSYNFRADISSFDNTDSRCLERKKKKLNILLKGFLISHKDFAIDLLYLQNIYI